MPTSCGPLGSLFSNPAECTGDRFKIQPMVVRSHAKDRTHTDRPNRTPNSSGLRATNITTHATMRKKVALQACELAAPGPVKPCKVDAHYKEFKALAKHDWSGTVNSACDTLVKLGQGITEGRPPFPFPANAR